MRNIFGKKKKGNGFIQLDETGLQVTYNNEVSFVDWSSIEKIIAYKTDLLTTDQIRLEIQFSGKGLFITEEFQGWRKLVSELTTRFKTIDPEWEEKIINPAYERKETILFDRK